MLENSDISGFSRQQQQFLAALVRTHRRGIPKSAFDALPDRLLAAVRRSSALLRLAVLLHRAHESDPIPQLDAHADSNTLTLTVSKRWLESRPLIRADLEGEPQDMAGLGIALKLLAA
ncbi:Exopolyphosphatase [compost metagenome]